MSGLTAYGHSHVGNVRPTNQDAIRTRVPDDEATIADYGLLYAIADGMGGYEHGGLASALALETFFSTFYGGRPGNSPQNMKRAVDTANLAVFQQAQKLGARMGTTLSAINVQGRQLRIAHIGDSRLYLVRGRKSTCLTDDHTAVGELVRLKLLSPDKVRKHERRSVLEKCLGMQLFVQPDVKTVALDEDDILILCTDGVWAYVEDDEFAQVARANNDPEAISKCLVEMAMQRDSDDNVSALVVHVETLPAASSAPVATRIGGFAQLLRNRLGGKA